MSEPTDLASNLRSLLRKLEALQSDPSWQQAQQAAQQSVEADQAVRERAQRALWLQRERVPVRAPIERAIVTGEPILLESTTVMRRTQQWLCSAGVPPVLVLAGPPGCGKTVAAAWALGQRGGRWRSAAQLVRLFAGLYGATIEEQDQALRCPLLVIDDLGSEAEPDRMAGTLVEVLNTRQHSRYRTIITTNLPRTGAGSFALRYPNERIASRFADPDVVTWVSDRGKDLRRAK